MDVPTWPGAPTVSAPLRIDDRTLHADLARAVATTPTGVVGGTTGAVLAFSGLAWLPPDRVLRAPLSGTPCVWYRTMQLRATSSTVGYSTLPSVASSNLGYHPGFSAPLSGTTASDLSSTTPFGIADEAGATVWVDPRRVDIDTKLKPVNQLAYQPQSGLAWLMTDDDVLHVEWIVPLGAPLFALGSGVRGGDGTVWLGPVGATPDGSQEAGLPLVTTDAESYVRSRAAFAVSPTGRWMRRIPIIVGLSAGLIALLVVAVLLVAELG